MIERRLEFARVPTGWWSVAAVMALLLLLAAAALFYRFERRTGASPRVRALLTILRCTVILLLAAAFLEPILATYTHQRRDAQTLILVDDSASMSLHDRYPDPAEHARVDRALSGLAQTNDAGISRWQIVQSLLHRDDGKLLAALQANNPVQLLRFSDEAKPLQQSASQVPATQATQPAGAAADAPVGAVTDIGRAIRQAVESRGGEPIAAIVALSDGQFNRGEPTEVVARYARDKRLAIHTVGIGDPSPPRNVTVVGVDAPPNVFVEDPYKITAQLRAVGLAGETITVELLTRGANDDAPQLIKREPVQIGPDGQVPPIIFQHRATEAAETRLTVRVESVAGEMLTDDNTRECTVRALANKMRVLIVAGAPSWEYRYLARLLERDATVNVSCWLQSADEDAVRDGNTVIDHLPVEAAELAEYDCIVLLDPQPVGIDAGWIARVESLIADRGSGLLYVAGRQHTPQSAHEPAMQPLLELLPVTIDAGEADLVLNELGHFQRAEWPVEIPPAVLTHPVLAMSDRPEDNAEVWARLGGVYWHYPPRREKPVATVLLRHSNPAMHNTYGSHVLLATQFVGSGRTGYLGFDTTWRWRRFGDAHYTRFWLQLLRHMVEGKLLIGQRRGFLQVDRGQVSTGEVVTVEARLMDARYQPLAAAEVDAAATLDGATQGTLRLTAQPNRPGWYRGQFTPTRVGTHSLRIDLPGEGDASPAVIRGEVRVSRPDLEFRQTPLNQQALQMLATGSAGGMYLHVDEVDRLPSLIPNQMMTMVISGQPVPLWDRWWTLVVLVGLLTAEWAIRKRVHLL